MIVKRKYGEPSYSTIKSWVRNDERYKQKHFVKKPSIIYSGDEKKNIVIELASRTKSAVEIAKDYNVTRETLYLWQNEYAGGTLMIKKEKSKQELLIEIEVLKKEHKQLEMENKILKKANEILKKK